jgi:hypothetical protein
MPGAQVAFPKLRFWESLIKQNYFTDGRMGNQQAPLHKLESILGPF